MTDQMTAGGCVDVHGHGVPRDFMEWACAAQPGGATVTKTDAGSYVVTFPGTAPTRPLKPQLLNLDQRAGWLAAQGAALQLLGPWLDVQGQELDPVAGGEWVTRLNDSLAAAAASSGGQLRALASVHLADPAAAARELERCAAEHAMTGIMIPTDFPGGDLADDRYAPLFEAAAGLRMPIILHPPTTGPSACVPGMKAWGMVYGRTLDTTMLAVRLITARVFDKYPGVQIVLVHGGGMLPYQAGRMQRGMAEKQGGPGPAAAAADLTRFYYDTVLLEPPALRMLAEVAGPGQVLIGSDYPFVDADPPLLGAFRQLTLADADRQAMLRGNADRLFRLNLDREHAT
jgi:aminocarboxymuconate-semialdehyde decarboxylase